MIDRGFLDGGSCDWLTPADLADDPVNWLPSMRSLTDAERLQWAVLELAIADARSAHWRHRGDAVRWLCDRTSWGPTSFLRIAEQFGLDADLARRAILAKTPTMLQAGEHPDTLEFRVRAWCASQAGVFCVPEVRAALSCRQDSVRRVLNRLVEAGDLLREPTVRGGYVVAHPGGEMAARRKVKRVAA